MGTEIILPGRNSRSRCQAIVNDLLFSPHPTQQLFHLRKQPFSLNDVFQCNVEGLSSARLRNLTGYPAFNRRYTHRLTMRPELMMGRTTISGSNVLEPTTTEGCDHHWAILRWCDRSLKRFFSSSPCSPSHHLSILRYPMSVHCRSRCSNHLRYVLCYLPLFVPVS